MTEAKPLLELLPPHHFLINNFIEFGNDIYKIKKLQTLDTEGNKLDMAWKRGCD